MADKKPRLKPIDEDLAPPPAIEDAQRYDVLVIPSNAGFRAAGNAIRSVVMSLNFRGFAKPVEEAIASDWAEIYCEPGPAAHEVFYERAYTGPEPVFKECVVYAGNEPAELDYGPPRPVYFMIEFRGCVYKEPLGPFRKLLMDSVNFRASVHVREHAGLKPHRTVADDEAPGEPAKKKRERGPGLAGTEVEEW